MRDDGERRCRWTTLVIGVVILLPVVPGVRADGDDPVVVRESEEPLPERAIRRFGSLRFRHGTKIARLAVSADGRIAVASSTSHPLSCARIIDLRDGRQLPLPGRPRSIHAVGVSPDGRRVVIRQFRRLFVCDAATGKELDTFEVPMGNPLMVTHWLRFTPDGSTVVQSRGENGVQFVRLESKKVVRTLQHQWRVEDGCFSPDGKLFAACDGNFIRLWNPDTGAEIRRTRTLPVEVASLAFAPDGRTLASGWDDGRLRSWDVATGKLQQEFDADTAPLRSIAYSHDGRTLAATGETIRLFDVETGKERLRLPHRAVGLHFSTDDRVLTAAVAGTVHRWNTRTGDLLTPAAGEAGVEQIELAEDGRTLVTRDAAGTVHLWNRDTGEHLLRVDGMRDYRDELAVSPDGRFLVMIADAPSVVYEDPEQNIGPIGGNRLRLFDITQRRFIDRFAPFEGDARDIAFTRDGRTLVTLDHRDGRARLWDFPSGRERHVSRVLPKMLIGKAYRVRGSELSPDDRTFAVTTRRHHNPDGTADPVTLRLWDVTTGEEKHGLAGHAADLTGLAFSADGRFLASCSESAPAARYEKKEFLLWNARTGRRVSLPGLETTPAYAVAFAPNGRLLVSGSLDGVVRVWETGSWTLRTEFRAHPDQITSLGFSPEGTMFTGSVNATVIEWDLRPPATDARGPLSAAWDGLLTREAASAYAVQGRLCATPAESVAFLAGKLRPAEAVDPERLAGLLADLDSAKFATRTAASRALRDLGPGIEHRLRETLAATTSDEVRRRVKVLLAEFEAASTAPTVLRALRAVEALEWMGTPAARRLLKELAEGDPHASLTRFATAAVARLDSGRK